MNRYPSRSVRTDRWKYIRNLDSAAEHHTHIDRGKAVDGSPYWASWVDIAKTDKGAAAIIDRYLRRPAEELYDLQIDPAEQQNLSVNRR
jgi:N-sulfoglucosamine sulfohydrolase